MSTRINYSMIGIFGTPPSHISSP